MSFMNQAAKRRWSVALNIIGIFAAFILLVVQCVNKPRLLARSVLVLSPNGKTAFMVQKNGTAQLVETKTGQIFYTRRISPRRYKSVTAAWQNNQAVKIYCDIRYPAMALRVEYLWNRNSGAITASWSDKVTDIRN